MSDTLYISKSRTLPESQDYQLLRTRGLEYIEALARKVWTDYNAHDPGITQLEALCYAITELGYRCGFDIKDLLADADGKTETDQAFFTAREILTNEPVTVEDYRKMLVDITGVHNAWLIPRQNVTDLTPANIPDSEVRVFPDCKKDRLTYTVSDHHPPIDIRGLYKILLDLDFTDEFGDLNSGNILYTFTEDELLGVQVEALLPNWRQANIGLIGLIYNKPINAIQVVKEKNHWNVKLTYKIGPATYNFEYKVTITMRKKLAAGKVLETEIEADLHQQIHNRHILAAYYAKLQHVTGILKTAWARLQAHRFLCEDFMRLDTVADVNIGFCADIDVDPQADLEEILAHIYFQIEEYFNPDVKFYSLGEMLGQGIPVDEIFDGPQLEHGFINTEELKNTRLRSEIRVSDIINFIMDIAGVRAVRNVQLTKYDSAGEPITPSEKWCVHLGPSQKPVLSISRSKILFFKDRLPFKALEGETLDTLRMLRGINERAKLKGHDADLPMPKGRYFNLEEYMTVQYELPQTYGVSEAGLSNAATDKRKGQAMQLRAYLMFYDQLLGGFLSQLAHAKDLFSLRTDLVDTYFQQYITDIKDIEKIYREVKDEQYGVNVTLEKILAPFNKNAATDAEKAAARRHNYLVESRETFGDRRNRFLDHLLARFAESFNEYVFMLYQSKIEKKSADNLITDKIAFLRDYPVISSQRGMAFDYTLPSWNTANVSGLEKRMARLTGIKDFTRRNLFCMKKIVLADKGVPGAHKWTFSLKDDNNKVVLVSVKEYEKYADADRAVNEVYDNIGVASSYRIVKLAADKYELLLTDGNNVVVAKRPGTFKKPATGEAHIKSYILRFAPKCDSEGMYLIEHILLRPFFPVQPPPVPPATPEDVYKLMQVCLNEECEFCGEEDPYSFRASVILPFWPERFRDMDFRRFFEKTIRTEAPAHISLKVCWVNYTTMIEFETIYREWLTALDQFGSDIIRVNTIKRQALMAASNKMVEFLKTVHSEYPEARLHDCETGVTNPVTLGGTVLGTF